MNALSHGRTLLASLVLSILLANAAWPQQLPRACVAKDQEPPPRGLPSTPPIIFDKPQIVHRQKSHFVRIFSDTAPKPGQRFDQCFRYEAENEGPDPINAFYWELASGMWIDPMQKDERHSRTVVRPVDDQPRVMPTRVFAFEKDSATTQAWAVVARPKGSAASSPGKEHASARLEWVNPGSIAGLTEFLKSRNLPMRALTAFHLEESGQAGSTLQDVYSAPRISVTLRSNVVRSGTSVTIDTEIVAQGEGSSEARYFMPALRALRPLQQPASLESYDEFLRRYVELRRDSSGYQAKWAFPLTMAASNLVNGAVYRMIHPIGVQYKGERLCFLAASYAPLPLSFSGNDCPLLFGAVPR